jgi:hypothetical protein
MSANLRLLVGVIVPAAFAFACSSSGDSKSVSGTGAAGGTDAGLGSAGGKAGNTAGGATGSSGGATGSTGGATGSTGGATGSTGGATGSTGGAASLACDTSACTGKSFGGQALAPCCQNATTCGVSVGGTNCISPSLLARVTGDGGIFGPPETIVPDKACPERQFAAQMGGAPTTLAGCCDKTGVCGVSTASFPSMGGFSIPTQCLTAADIQRLGAGTGMALGGDAGPQTACTYPTGG